VLQETHEREEIIERVAALDIGKAELTCCAPAPPRPHRPRRWRGRRPARHLRRVRRAGHHRPPPDRPADGQPRPGHLPRRIRHLHLPPPPALCTHGDGPDLGTCQPLRCRNAAFTPANRDAVCRELARIDASLIQAPALPPYLQHTLTARRQAITALLAGQEGQA
jgi:hypothetical protein